MRKSLFYLQFARPLALYALVATPLMLSSAEALGEKEHLRLIKEQLDSLEVEKQTNKRQGLPITDLEHATTELRDSVARLREEVLQSKKQPAAIPDISLAITKIFPTTVNLIDSLLITAAVLIAAMFIVVYLLSGLKRRRKKAAARPMMKRYEPGQNRERRMETAVQKAYDAQRSKPVDQAAMPEAPPPSPLPPPSSHERSSDSKPDDRGNLNDLVIQADRQGMDIKTISERYHVGVDQVALILKMAKKK